MSVKSMFWVVWAVVCWLIRYMRLVKRLDMFLLYVLRWLCQIWSSGVVYDHILSIRYFNGYLTYILKMEKVISNIG